ncbi:MAG: hypothetical protein KAG56_04385 [Sulfurovaceae bacterium]|nr:hypothetical protein [Sulfurovaceae bacterium]
MKKAFKLLLISALSLFAIGGCTTEKEKVIEPTVNTDRFRTLNANRNTEGIRVVCTNCTAKFKISHHAMKSGTTVKCPKCKHHYRTGQH